MNILSKFSFNNQAIIKLTSEIRIELNKLTNLIQKQCNYCSSSQKQSIYSYEKDGIVVFVCSNCIVKLALNDLYDQRMNGNNDLQKNLLRKELLSISAYIETLLADQAKNTL